MKEIRIFYLSVLLCGIINYSFSHPGGLDKYGGHYVRKAGTGYPVGSYHYHKGKYAGYTVSKKGEIPEEFRIRKNNQNNIKGKELVSSNNERLLAKFYNIGIYGDNEKYGKELYDILKVIYFKKSTKIDIYSKYFEDGMINWAGLLEKSKVRSIFIQDIKGDTAAYCSYGTGDPLVYVSIYVMKNYSQKEKAKTLVHEIAHGYFYRLYKDNVISLEYFRENTEAFAREVEMALERVY